MKISQKWILFIVVWLVILYTSSSSYPGFKLFYALYSVFFCLLFFYGISNSASYGVTFLVVTIWIGLWLKLALHLIYRSDWVEPIGMFDGLPSSWDQVLLISMSGTSGIFVALVLSNRFLANKATITEYPLNVFAWFQEPLRRILWLGVYTIIFITFTTNEAFNIIKLGYRPALDLLWPWQGLFGWWCNIGLALLVATFLGLDWVNKKSLWLGVIGISVAGGLISASIHSRGLFVFFLIPLLFVLWNYRSSSAWLTKVRWCLILTLVTLCLSLSVIFSQYQRNMGTDALPLSKSTGAKIRNNQEFLAYLPGQFKRLALDRWLGLEGIMAVSSYPSKGWPLFLQAITERRTKDHVDLYTAKISLSGFTDADTTRYHYATMPGAIGFLYLSASYFVVFFGMLLLTLLLIIAEVLVGKATGNPFLSALSGMYITLLIIQLGAGGVVQPLTSYVITILFTLLIGLFLKFMNSIKSLNNSMQL